MSGYNFHRSVRTRGGSRGKIRRQSSSRARRTRSIPMETKPLGSAGGGESQAAAGASPAETRGTRRTISSTLRFVCSTRCSYIRAVGPYIRCAPVRCVQSLVSFHVHLTRPPFPLVHSYPTRLLPHSAAPKPLLPSTPAPPPFPCPCCSYPIPSTPIIYPSRSIPYHLLLQHPSIIPLLDPSFRASSAATMTSCSRCGLESHLSAT